MSDLVMMFGDLVEKNGKTVYANNIEKMHKFPVGTKVYLEFENTTTLGPKFEKGIYTIFSQDRDCDGTPIYSVISESLSVVEDWKMFNHDIMKLIPKLGCFGYQCGVPECVIMDIPQLAIYSGYIMEQFEKEYKNYK